MRACHKDLRKPFTTETAKLHKKQRKVFPEFLAAELIFQEVMVSSYTKDDG